jgi:hypothetical protein
MPVVATTCTGEAARTGKASAANANAAAEEIRRERRVYVMRRI